MLAFILSNVWRTLFIVASIVACIFAWSLDRAESKNALLTKDIQFYEVVNTEWMTHSGKLSADLKECQSNWKTTEATQAQQVEDLEKQAKQARAEAAAWKDRWETKTSSCSLLLEDLNTFCPELEGY